jgi:hypothetical protein
MASAESIHRLLSAATMLLDRAAAEIRDASLEPVRHNITQVGKAIAEVFEIQRAIYDAHPHLRPEHLTAPDLHPEANRRLTLVMLNAQDHEQRDDVDEAIATFREFLALEETPLHRDIALGEIARLKRKKNG